MRATKILLIGFLILVPPSPALAVDHENLDKGRPLRLQDAYPIAHGEMAVEAGVGYDSKRGRTDQAAFPLVFLYGALPNFHVEVGTAFITSPHEIDEPQKSGDIDVGALYNFNQETLAWPALGIKGEVKFPTGVDSSGVDFELTGLITKSLYRLGMHFNASYEVIGGAAADERDGRYHFVFGASYPLGAPMYTRTVLMADVFLEQASHSGESDVAGAEVGFRHQLRERMVLDAGIGSEFDGPEGRSRFFARAGVSFSF